MFIIYVNDIHLNTSFSIRLFADDASLSLSHSNPKTLESTVNKELKVINNWLKSNKLFLNYSKTNFLIFSKRKNKYKFSINIDNHNLQQEHTTKYLGITIDDKLTWKPHLSKLRTNLSRGCYALSRLKMYMPQDVMKSVYYSLFHSKLQYCITSWGGCPPTNQLPIFRLQKRALRLICSKPHLTPSHPLFIETNILKLSDIYRPPLHLQNS